MVPNKRSIRQRLTRIIPAKKRPPLDQLQSPLFASFPFEIRETIYLELWKSAGLAQHVHFGFFETKGTERGEWHFWHSPCVTEFEVEDDRQTELQALLEERQDPMLPPPESLTWTEDHEWHAALNSPLYNHWRCEDAMERDSVTLSPYLPILLSCKRLYSECIRSIYEHTEFVFTDVDAIQKFLGFCGQIREPHRPPEAFLKYTRGFQLSVSVALPLLVPCCAEPTSLHTVYDLHWLRLQDMENLRTVKIWIDAQRKEDGIRTSLHYRPISELDTATLSDSLKDLNADGRLQVTISTPLNKDVGPISGYGYVTDVSRPGVRVWKRNVGDRFLASSLQSGAIYYQTIPIVRPGVDRRRPFRRRRQRRWPMRLFQENPIPYR